MNPSTTRPPRGSKRHTSLTRGARPALIGVALAVVVVGAAWFAISTTGPSGAASLTPSTLSSAGQSHLPLSETGARAGAGADADMAESRPDAQTGAGAGAPTDSRPEPDEALFAGVTLPLVSALTPALDGVSHDIATGADTLSSAQALLSLTEQLSEVPAPPQADAEWSALVTELRSNASILLDATQRSEPDLARAAVLELTAKALRLSSIAQSQ